MAAVEGENLAGLFGIKPSEHAAFMQQMATKEGPGAIKHGVKTMTNMLMSMGKQVTRSVIQAVAMTRGFEDFAESSVQTRKTTIDPLTGEERTTTEYVMRDDRTQVGEKEAAESSGPEMG